MNIRQISSHVVIVIVAVLGTLIAVYVLKPATVFGTKRDITINYEVNAQANKLEITGMSALPTNHCNSGKPRGCFKIDENDKGLIKFVFKHPANQWVLDQFKLCPGNTKIDGPCSLTSYEQLEFSVMNDAQGTQKLQPTPSGEVKLAGLVGHNKVFYLFDQNTFAQTYFYNIRVCQQSDPTDCLTLDPPIENKGLK